MVVTGSIRHPGHGLVLLLPQLQPAVPGLEPPHEELLDRQMLFLVMTSFIVYEHEVKGLLSINDFRTSFMLLKCF